MMRDLRSILLLLFLLPAISLAQTVHHEKDKIVYTGKIKLQSTGDGYNQSKSFLLSNANADSIKDDKETKALIAIAMVKLPSEYHLQKWLRYKIKLAHIGNSVHYEIDEVQLVLHERGDKKKVLTSEELLKGMDESGNTARDAEKTLNEIDMYIQQFISKMHSALTGA